MHGEDDGTKTGEVRKADCRGQYVPSQVMQEFSSERGPPVGVISPSTFNFVPQAYTQNVIFLDTLFLYPVIGSWTWPLYIWQTNCALSWCSEQPQTFYAPVCSGTAGDSDGKSEVADWNIGRPDNIKVPHHKNDDLRFGTE